LLLATGGRLEIGRQQRQRILLDREQRIRRNLAFAELPKWQQDSREQRQSREATPPPHVISRRMVKQL
jgi:hypothetical protein